MKNLLRNLAKSILIKMNRFVPIYDKLREINEDRFAKAVLDDLKRRDNIDVNKTPKIEVVNLNANDVCNSRCVMCNIWKQKKTYEFTPEDLYNILSDPLYKDVKHIGVTGGEPTLRPDLADLFESIFKALPGSVGASTITNCIKDQEVIARIDKVIEVCKKYDKSFSIMVSLDGVGEVHEKVRRIRGNFQSAMNVINYFQNKGIPLATGSTISKVNVWDVDELLDFLKENNIYGRFRIAEFIKRLYNDQNGDVIRNFSEDESYHLILFFYKLIYTFEKNETFIRTYKSIINILSGGTRLIGCPYKESGIVLNSRGELSYCAPKSKIIGSSLEASSLSIYKENLEEKKRIFVENCDSCVHDYHSSITYKEKLIELEDQKWRNKINFSSVHNINRFNKIAQKRSGFQVFITGWYGTETVGDKAILAQIIIELKEEYGNDINIIVSSLFPLITQRTLKELDEDKVKTVAVYSEDFIAYAKGSDLIVMGGGPLMDLDELAIPLIAFKLGKKFSRKNVIYGCGLGPLVFDRNIDAVKEMLNLADVIKLRDQKSIDIAKSWLNKDIAIELSGDPAKKYLKRYDSLVPDTNDSKILTCYLREWTHEYARNLSPEEFKSVKEKMELGLSEFIKMKAIEIGATEIYFDHMHNFVIGNDDRDFSRYFIKKYMSDSAIPVSYNKQLSTVESVAKSMKNSDYNISMRFHSVVFAHTLGTRFSAIDYTLGGKIYNYLKDNDCLEHLVPLNDFINEQN